MLRKILLWTALLTSCAWAQSWPKNTDFEGPPELLRAARDLRLDLGDLGPVQFRGGSNFGSGFTSGDLSKFSLAISYFERACLRIDDPRDTVKVFHDLEQSYQRAWRPGPYGTASVRDITKIMTRLERFYAALEEQASPTPEPTP